MAISKAEKERTKNENLALLESIANREGLDEEGRIVLRKIMLVESNGQTNAANPNSRARGLFQVIPDTWNKYAAKYADINTVTALNENTSVDPRFDKKQQMLFAVRFTRDNERALTTALGGAPPTASQLYKAHFLGVGGGKEKGAIDIIKEAENNPNTPIKGFLPNKIFAPNSDVRLSYPNGDILHMKNFTVSDMQVWARRKMEQPDGYDSMDRARYRKSKGILDFIPDALGNMEMSTLTMIAAAIVALIGVAFSGNSSGSQSPSYTPPSSGGGGKKGLFF